PGPEDDHAVASGWPQNARGSDTSILPPPNHDIRTGLEIAARNSRHFLTPGSHQRVEHFDGMDAVLGEVKTMVLFHRARPPHSHGKSIPGFHAGDDIIEAQ